MAQGKLGKDLASGCICKLYKTHRLGMAECPPEKRVNKNKGDGVIPVPSKEKGSTP